MLFVGGLGYLGGGNRPYYAASTITHHAIILRRHHSCVVRNRGDIQRENKRGGARARSTASSNVLAGGEWVFSQNMRYLCLHMTAMRVAMQFRTLVEDGVRYSAARLAEARSGNDTTGINARRSSYTSLSEANSTAAEDSAAEAETDSPGEQEDGSDDSLVE